MEVTAVQPCEWISCHWSGRRWWLYIRFLLPQLKKQNYRGMGSTTEIQSHLICSQRQVAVTLAKSLGCSLERSDPRVQSVVGGPLCQVVRGDCQALGKSRCQCKGQGEVSTTSEKSLAPCLGQRLQWGSFQVVWIICVHGPKGLSVTLRLPSYKSLRVHRCPSCHQEAPAPSWVLSGWPCRRISTIVDMHLLWWSRDRREAPHEQTVLLSISAIRDSIKQLVSMLTRATWWCGLSVVLPAFIYDMWTWFPSFCFSMSLDFSRPSSTLSNIGLMEWPVYPLNW